MHLRLEVVPLKVLAFPFIFHPFFVVFPLSVLIVIALLSADHEAEALGNIPVQDSVTVLTY